ncbi:hypothetical protein OAD28_01385 [Flavobacteriales bacterium]|nr:hypothetical protein [Flavobacteriales bacterium]
MPKKLNQKKILLIILSFILAIIAIGIVVLVILILLPLSFILILPFLLIIIYKIGKDVDVIVANISLIKLIESIDQKKEKLKD